MYVCIYIYIYKLLSCFNTNTHVYVYIYIYICSVLVLTVLTQQLPIARPPGASEALPVRGGGVRRASALPLPLQRLEARHHRAEGAQLS